MAQLTVSLNSQVIKRLKLIKPSYLIGRSPQCDIQLPERTVSSQHARLVVAGEDCFLEDLNSTNGIYINNQMAKRHLLMDNDQIHIGKYQLLFSSEVGLLTQIRQLSVHPRLIDQQAQQAQLEIISGRKQGQVIPLTKNRVTLGSKETGTITIERNQTGDYLLHSLNENKVKSVSKLQAGDTFSIGEIELRFHPAE